MEPTFLDLLQEIKEETNLIPDKIDVRDKYGIYRSLRRGSNTEAVNQGVDQDDIDLKDGEKLKVQRVEDLLWACANTTQRSS